MKKAITILVISLLSCINAIAVQSGKCGDDATWVLSDDSVLTISGTGEIKKFDIDKNKVKEVVIEDGITAIGMSSFSSFFELRNITIPNSVTTIKEEAFEGCTGLTNINIPNSVTSIEYEAFYECTGLTNINIPNSVTKIGDKAFAGCTGLTNITIPNSVKTIEDDAFTYCQTLESIDVANGNENYMSIDGVLYDKKKENTYNVPSKKD